MRWRRLQRRLWRGRWRRVLLRRWRRRGQVGCGGVVRHVKRDSPGKASDVGDGSIDRAGGGKGIQGKEAWQERCVDKRGPSVWVDL
jgi:hypothetical protein